VEANGERCRLDRDYRRLAVRRLGGSRAPPDVASWTLSHGGLGAPVFSSRLRATIMDACLSMPAAAQHCQTTGRNVASRPRPRGPPAVMAVPLMLRCATSASTRDVSSLSGQPHVLPVGRPRLSTPEPEPVLPNLSYQTSRSDEICYSGWTVVLGVLRAVDGSLVCEVIGGCQAGASPPRDGLRATLPLGLWTVTRSL
jgi:hypothetical protein